LNRQDKVELLLKEKTFLTELKESYDIARIIRKMTVQSLLPHELFYLYDSLNLYRDLFPKKNKLGVNHGFICSAISGLSSEIEIDKEKRSLVLDSSFFLNLPEDIKNIIEKIEEIRSEIKVIIHNLEIKLSAKGKLRLIEKLDSLKITAQKGLAAKAKEEGIPFTVKASELNIESAELSSLSDKFILNKNLLELKLTELWLDFQSKYSEKYGHIVLALADSIAEIDVLSTFAKLAEERSYNRAKISDNGQKISLLSLRHPVVEISNKLDEDFVPNDLALDTSQKKTLVLYGPNSSGKSTFLKSVSLSVIMNQIGSFIPAAAGSELSIFDAILTRTSSSDNISEGMSTFVVEMNELNFALKNTNKNALIILDEVGRGSDSSDGEGLAYGTLLFLDDKDKNCITLFATHYHNLSDQIKDFDSVVIKNVSCVCDETGKLIYYRKISDGPGEGS
jgi:DNA mismatch repair protein MutS